MAEEERWIDAAGSCEAVIQLVLLLLCVYLSWTDIQSRRIPNCVLLAGFVALALIRLGFCEMWSFLMYVVYGCGFLLLFGLAAWFWPDAVGMGDVKLLGLFGFALGVQPFVFVVTTASFCAFLWSLFLLIVKRVGTGFTLPFAPFLTFGLLVFLLMES